MTKDEIMEIIENADAYELAAAFSEYISEELYDPDNALYAVEELDEILYGHSYSDVMNKVFYGNYSPSADFVTFDGYGNFESVHASEVVDYVTFRLDDEDLAAVAEML